MVGSPPEQQLGQARACCVQVLLTEVWAGLLMVWLVHRARPGLLVLALGGSASVPTVPGGRGASAAETSLRQPSHCPPLPSEPALPSLGNQVGSGSACGLWLLLLPSPFSSSQSSIPEAQTQEDLQFLGLWVQESRRSLGWGGSSGFASASTGSGTQLSLALPPVKWAQACIPVLLASQDCCGHPVRWPSTGPRTVFAQ